MANIREVRDRMKSVQDIMKITNAMYLISSSKLKKVRKRLEATQPYFEKLQSTIRDILAVTPDIQHRFFDTRPQVASGSRKRGYIVVTADKGLAGAYNHNVLKLAEQEMESGSENYLFVVGQVGRQYFTRKGIMIDVEFLYTAQDPTLYRARDIAETIIDLFLQRELDEVYIIFTEMVTSMKMEPRCYKLLPLERTNFDVTEKNTYRQCAAFMPTPEIVMDDLVPNYLKGLIYSILVEAYSSEQNARMMAMESATDSAKEMIRDLSLQFNRARQAAITQEITEVVSGAESLNL